MITNQSTSPPRTPGTHHAPHVAGRSRRRHTARACGGYDELPDQARIPQQPSTLRKGRYQRRDLLRLVDLSVVSSSPSNAQPPTASNASHTTVRNSARMGPTFPQAHIPVISLPFSREDTNAASSAASQCRAMPIVAPSYGLPHGRNSAKDGADVMAQEALGADAPKQLEAGEQA